MERELKRIKLDLDDEPDQQVGVCKITDIPTEILIKIFDFLPLEDFKAANLVCRQWFNIASMELFLMKYPLVLYGSFNCSEPPLSVFFDVKEGVPKTSRDFKYLRVKLENRQTLKPKHFSKLNTLVSKIGKKVKRLDLINFKSKYYQSFIDQFPNLTILGIEFFYCLKYIKFLPPKLVTLIVSRDHLVVKSDISEILNRFVQLKNIIISEAKLRVCFGRLEVDAELPDETAVPLVHINNEFQKFCRNINDAIYIMKNLDIRVKQTIACEDIREVMLDSPTNLTVLAQLKKLETLNLNGLWDIFGCIEFHSKTLMPSVKKFNLTQMKICPICFKTLIESLPGLIDIFVFFSGLEIIKDIEHCKKLKSLCCLIETNDVNKDVLLLEGFEELKEITFIYRANDCFLDKELNIGYKPNIEKFTLIANDVDSAPERLLNLEKFCMQWPNLTSLSLGLETFTLEAAEIILKGWPKLTYLSVHLYSEDKNFLERFCSGFIKLITKHCEFLKTFEFKIKCNVDSIWIESMFKEIRALKKIKINNHFCTRF